MILALIVLYYECIYNLNVKNILIIYPSRIHHIIVSVDLVGKTVSLYCW